MDSTTIGLISMTVACLIIMITSDIALTKTRQRLERKIAELQQELEEERKRH